MNSLMKFKLIMSHGLESNAYGDKLRWLAATAASRGVAAESINYYTAPPENGGVPNVIRDPAVRLEMLEARLHALKQADPFARFILLGSSMGGWVSSAAAARQAVDGLFLLAPALDIEGYPFQPMQLRAKEVTMVHGFDDNVIPFANSVAFAKQHDAMLIGLPDGHRLQNDFNALAQSFHLLLDRLKVERNSPAKRIPLAKRIAAVLYWLDPMNTGCVENSLTDEYVKEALMMAEQYLHTDEPLENVLASVMAVQFNHLSGKESSQELKSSRKILKTMFAAVKRNKTPTSATIPSAPDA